MAKVTSRKSRLRSVRLYFVCEGNPRGREPETLLRAAFQGGADMAELRDKDVWDADLLASAATFRRAADQQGALFILNDRPDLVAACGADGVHVGQEDTPASEARRTLGPDGLIGLSTHSEEQIEAACAAEGPERPDYISVGPVWETPTKAGRPGTGLELVEFAAREANLPWFAIGGIDVGNVDSVVAAGARRVVVVRAIRDAEDPEGAARRLSASLTEPARLG